MRRLAVASAATSRRGSASTPPCIDDRYGERDLAADIDAYDRRRNEGRPPWKQRNPERWGEAAFYGWSEDKARQYAEPLRADFGAFVRKKGFKLD